MEVVPDVNWMLTMSLFDRAEDAVGGDVSESRDIESNGVVARNEVASIRPEELSRRTICFNNGIASDSSFDAVKSGTIVSKIDIVDRGALNGWFVSVPITRWVADKWFKAEIICVALKAGLSGTRMAPSLKSAYVKVANSMLFPSDTQTRSPFLTPKLCKPWASMLLSLSSSA